MVLSYMVAALIAPATGFAERQKYRVDPDDQSCDGFPQLPIETAAGLCVGLVLGPDAQDASGRFNLLLPRRIAALPDGRGFVVTDLGRWDRRTGRIWWVREIDGGFRLTLLYMNLDRPHGLAVASDGSIYVGLPGRVARIAVGQMTRAQPGGDADLQTVIELPDRAGHAHPLTQVILGADDRSMLVALGSPSDACLDDVPTGRCAERDQFAEIRAFRADARGQWKPGGERLAGGLRNPLAMARHRSGSVWAADNAMDLPSAASPMEPLNRIEAGKSYGWPYCIDDLQPSPSWRDRQDRCRDEAPPFALLPPHAAPLDLAFVSSPLLGGENMLMTWHGYRASGGRVVALPVDDSGTPGLASQGAQYGFTMTDVVMRLPYPLRIAVLAPRLKELVTRWDLVPGLRPQGAPTGIAMGADGSIWITEDKNRTIVRLSHGRPYLPAKDKYLRTFTGLAPEVERGFADLVQSVLQPRCGGCHTDQLQGSPAQSLRRLIASEWLSAAAERLDAAGERRMPPSGPLAQSERERVLHFLAMLPER